MLKKSYGELFLSKTQVYEWYKVFKEGRKEIQDLPRSNRPSTGSTNENIEKNQENGHRKSWPEF